MANATGLEKTMNVVPAVDNFIIKVLMKITLRLRKPILTFKKNYT